MRRILILEYKDIFNLISEDNDTNTTNNKQLAQLAHLAHLAHLAQLATLFLYVLDRQPDRFPELSFRYRKEIKEYISYHKRHKSLNESQ